MAAGAINFRNQYAHWHFNMFKQQITITPFFILGVHTESYVYDIYQWQLMSVTEVNQ